MLSSGHSTMKSSQCLVHWLQGDLLPGEHQLLSPTPVTPQGTEARVLPGQHQGRGSLVSLPQTWGQPWTLGVGKQHQER